MQIVFVHPNFPAQFAGILSRLAQRPDVEPVFVTSAATGAAAGVRCIRYRAKGGATASNHYCSRSFENGIWNAHAVYEACKQAELSPDLVVGHSGLGTTLFLRELYDVPIVGYFEYFYRPHGTDMDFRAEFPPSELDFLRARARNAMVLLDLEACAGGYTPTHWQHGLFPDAWKPRIEVIHDGVDLERWQRRPVRREIGGNTFPDDVPIVTYVSRGLESMRGFDIFVRVAKRISKALPNAMFLVVGSDRVCYGNDLVHVPEKSFREHVWRAERPDPSRFHFLGTLPPARLAEILSLSDLHVYLTVPFVLSWSLLDAMACECPVLASDTAPVREVVSDG